MDLNDRLLAVADQIRLPENRPFVTLSYAQSLDGSIAIMQGERTQISGPESTRLTHQLRANHDAILIGIGTLLADDPHLTVRFVEGHNPQPVVLDRNLRIPVDSYLVQSNPPWIVTLEDADPDKVQELISLGAKLIYVPDSKPGHLHIDRILEALHARGIQRLMVEGGARVITSFLEARLIDFMVVTISPLILGGLPAVSFPRRVGSTTKTKEFIKLDRMNTTFNGEDLVVFGCPVSIKPG